ncbi:right-handed parallel beta-helix repeat-containing protein [Parapedobacter soli]|uniref:right-handed parallel beta-helix repeat-containing protein n=1 Tax=Parapedobacter soli TaxID=416955 RepID=UPI0021C9FDF2|nr:right-handed parallel beta-helix repeat-containing protein [Parapedobacter soli]
MIKRLLVIIAMITAFMLHGCEKWVEGGMTEVDPDTTATTEVNVLDFESAATTDHEMIQLAINYAYDNGIASVFVPAGMYEIDAAGVNGDRGIGLKDGITLRLDPAAVLKAIPNAANHYSIVRVWDVSRVKVTGGTILGERNEHTGTTGEYGMGIDIRNSDSVTVQDVLIKYCWGDGIYVSGETVGCRDVLIDNVTCDSNRRQGISVENIDGFVLRNSVLSNTIGTAPQSGIDIEPYLSTQSVRNVLITGTSFLKNRGKGLTIFAAYGEVSDVRVENCIADSNYNAGIQLNSGAPMPGEKNLQRVSISNVTITNTVQDGLFIRTSANIDVDSTRVLDSGLRGIWVVNSSDIALDSFTVRNTAKEAREGVVVISDSERIAASRGIIDVGYATPDVFTLIGSDSLTFSSLSVSGGATGLDGKNLTNVLVSDVDFSAQAGDGVRLDSVYHSVFEDSHFEGIGKTPVYLHNGADNEFTGNSFIGNCHASNDTYSVLQLSGSSNGNTISNNSIQQGSHTNKAKYGIWLMPTTSSNTVSSNTIANDAYVVSAILDEGSGNVVN